MPPSNFVVTAFCNSSLACTAYRCNQSWSGGPSGELAGVASGNAPQGAPPLNSSGHLLWFDQAACRDMVTAWLADSGL